ncbi:N-acetylhexosaminidase [Cantharellus anzutake]|uniref:N-acetylhexosaminidase n=1 Tax=Cantharellus anzutake TaxID=1750568 RepID=UPI0019069598|nr:N-acetylhexosaminidase [Cantharellus anzutake]KAF8333584.1 N-acetylhexosaminidase [Cantharellus anzutake]
MAPFSVILLVHTLAIATGAYSLWPMPRQLQSGSTALMLSNHFNFELSGVLLHSVPPDLQQAISRTSAQLKHDKLERLVVGGATADARQIVHAKTILTLTLSLHSTASKVLSISQCSVLPLEERDESYSLIVPADGSAGTLSANTTLGLFRGLTTFSQLWYWCESTAYTIEAPFIIHDSPAYPYRGFMLDTARNYFPIPDILRTLDAMSYVKANAFHWHVVDSQSFPLVVEAFPELSAKGAYTQNEVYTPHDVKQIVSYAAARGIDILVEIDTPGHTSAISKSHPEYIACPEGTPWSTYANEPPAGQLRLATASVIEFTQNLIKSVLPSLPSKYFSTGGDEINTNCYSQDPETQSELEKKGWTLDQALGNFVGKIHSTVASLGKTPVVWEDLVLSHNLTLANNTIVMVWISSQNAAAVVQKGYRIVHAPSDYFYLDCGHGDWVGESPQGNSWCDPFKTWQKAYTFDPQASIPDTQKHLVLGGQQLLWTEQSSPASLDSIAWPRAAVSSEVFWTGSILPSGNYTNVGEALQRLHALRYRFVQRGINAITLQPHWCAVRPHACDLTA